MQVIKDIVDKHLERFAFQGLCQLPLDEIEPEMRDPNEDPEEEWKTWYPIDSQVSDGDITAFEQEIGYGLPLSYRSFLQHKHFYELAVGAATFKHPVRIWPSYATDMIFNGYPREFLIDQGYIPFADYSDWGLLCFDTNAKVEAFDYPVVLWDHELPEDPERVYNNFVEMLIDLDKKGDDDNS